MTRVRDDAPTGNRFFGRGPDKSDRGHHPSVARAVAEPSQAFIRRQGHRAEVLPPDLVRWGSAVLLLPYVAVFVGDAVYGSGRQRLAPETIRASRPRTRTAGRLSDLLQVYAAVALLLEALVPGWVYGSPLTSSFPGDTALQVAGLASWPLSLALLVWSSRHLGAYGWEPTAVYRDHRLVRSGPYRWIRHPLYSALLWMNGGAALFLLNPILAALFVATYAVVRREALDEEGLLASAEGLGDEYQAYMRRTGRFLPRLRHAARRSEPRG